ncbi:uncharacterized protein LOC118010071 [Mirounga leonina]|uniref:uncharacterized protein LOC118010071 n=1 Tax=Mirounga leonina TaxID=9715 RepID=UPI00156C195F|nr:uncharacterized protein LOC118010071 [Mirounga leonina]
MSGTATCLHQAACLCWGRRHFLTVELGGAGKTGPRVPHGPPEELGPDLHVHSFKLVPGKQRGKNSSGPSECECVVLPSYSSYVFICASAFCRGFENRSWRLTVPPRILSERLISPCLPCRLSSCRMADEFRGKGTSYCIVTSFPSPLFWGDFARTFFLLHRCVSLLPQFPGPTAHSCQVGLPQTQSLCCAEKPSAAVHPAGNGARPLPSRSLAPPTIDLPTGTPIPARVLTPLFPALHHAVPTTGVSLPFSLSVQTLLPWQRVSSVTFPEKVAHRGLPRVQVGHSLVLLIIFSHICLSSSGKLLFPSKKGAGVLFS